jgi:4'-phosphopantetheinyl transferase
MLKIFHADVRKVDINAAGPLSDYRMERIRRLKNEKKIKESIGAELLLNHAAKLCFPGIALPLNIICSEYGKPEIADAEFQFSLSHSERHALCAISDGIVGADIQYTAKFNDGISRRFFAENERDYILSQSDRDAAFTEIWCKKESFIKAAGTGLSTPLESFSVIGREDIFHTAVGKYHIAICAPDGIAESIELTEMSLE